MTRNLTYFVSDVHLGLRLCDPADREARFVKFLKSIPRDTTDAVYLLGDIWDFWYEYRDVVPKGYVRVFAELLDLMDNGVKVKFFQGNHDIWCFHYFQDLGIEILQQPYVVDIAGKKFCLGHGDGLGPGYRLYKLMRWGFRHPFFQGLFSLLHPTLAFRFGNGWSKSSRKKKFRFDYQFRGKEESLYKFCESFAAENKIDYFIFGHYHCHVDMPVGESGSRLLVMKDWLSESSYLYFDGISVSSGQLPKTE